MIGVVRRVSSGESGSLVFQGLFIVQKSLYGLLVEGYVVRHVASRVNGMQLYVSKLLLVHPRACECFLSAACKISGRKKRDSL